MTPSAVYIGFLCEQITIWRLLERGYNVAKPIVDQGADIWVQTATGVRKVQIKKIAPRHGSWRAPRLQTGGAWHKVPWETRRSLRDQAKVVDFFIGVDLPTRDCFVIPAAHVRHRTYVSVEADTRERWDLLGPPASSPVRSDRGRALDNAQAGLFDLARPPGAK